MTIGAAGPQLELLVERLEITRPVQLFVKTGRMIDVPSCPGNEALAVSKMRCLVARYNTISEVDAELGSPKAMCEVFVEFSRIYICLPVIHRAYKS